MKKVRNIGNRLLISIKFVFLIIHCGFVFFSCVVLRALNLLKGRSLGKKRTREDHDQLKLSNIDFF
jgi:hypothetical protein